MTKDEMVGWHHRLNGHEFGSTPGVGDGQGGLACCSPWSRKESDTTESLNNSRNWTLHVHLASRFSSFSGHLAHGEDRQEHTPWVPPTELQWLWNRDGILNF